METLNLILNLIIVSYIIMKELDAIKSSIHKSFELAKEYYEVFKKQLIIRAAESKSYDEVIEEVAATKIEVESELSNDTDTLLATCIAVGEDGTEVIVDYDFRGEDAAPLGFQMFGGVIDQHYDLSFIKSLGGEKRSTDHYYAFDRTIFDMKKQGRVINSYVLVLNKNLGTIKKAIEANLVNSQEYVAEQIDIKEEIKEPCQKDDITILEEEIAAGVINKEFLELLLKINTDSIVKKKKPMLSRSMLSR